MVVAQQRLREAVVSYQYDPTPEPPVGEVLQSPKDVARWFHRLAAEDLEHFVVICLDRNFIVLGWREIAVGAQHHMTIDLQSIGRLVLLSGAELVVLLHNHPSGTLEFSSFDIQLTKKIGKMIEHHGAQVMDHVLITHRGCIAMFDRASRRKTLPLNE
jgi:DNA repair protein RadC